MQGLQDVSNELMTHYTWMLNYLAGLKNDRPASLSPVLLLVNNDCQRMMEAPTPPRQTIGLISVSVKTIPGMRCT
ncbi:hypothetical protein HF329_09705 [Chitinophaga oryzae]|uniref:Uncharacterized protein n=1 Tax=Chitinophaga oryzae TaxID=2725414 RepID=A0AAE6ZEM9_9BACT|nr:hypothetical protein [Chitinophaga oryzae]QJB31568.1 hypothetical protein HF329_09705 [Chitinophaga oryzae]